MKIPSNYLTKRKRVLCEIGILFFFLIGALSGCALGPKEKETFIRQDYQTGLKRIAVLPFYNLSDRIDAEILVTNILIGRIVNEQKLSVVKYGDIREFLLQQKIRSTETITLETLQNLANTFAVDGVMVGTINDYQEWDPSHSGEPAVVDISARLLDSGSGQIIWSGRERRTGWDEKLFFDVDEVVFCSQLVEKTVCNFLKEVETLCKITKNNQL